MIPTARTLAKYGLSEKQRAQLKRLHADRTVVEKMQAGRAARQGRRRAELEARVQTGLIACAKCLTPKPPSEYPGGRKTRRGEPRFRYCKPCHNDYQRTNRLRWRFSLTIEDYDKILAFQNGVCAICEKAPAKLRLAVDHNHKTGLIRGLLCAWCNRAIGQFRDNMDRVNRVVAYFATPPCTSALGSDRFGDKGKVSNKAATRKRLNREAA